VKLYTGKGDKGMTSILGSDKLPKYHLRIEAYGTIDELNSIIGILYHHTDESYHQDFNTIQSMLFEIGSELASTEPRQKIHVSDVKYLETLIDRASAQTPALTSFILPGGHISASWFHLARTVTRRAERLVVQLSHETSIDENIVPWLNRLSDLFFAWARLANHQQGIEDVPWVARK
jgi:cob(I)alamin adenosyltransferase